ncbi:uncharacterized protein LOC132940596 [Metopolophium dirhodum]|uniref:uncharacterized protein LOC132940596 n=1 Tax=Metopolophium dirhodum TaxID=44670 RepID=UPI00298F610A|nr:uncharacterized protein LOC132940596 [Metopolophium dirhodum]
MADLKIKCGFQPVTYSFIFPNDKGKRLVESGHLINVEEIKPATNHIAPRIKGLCIRQTSVSYDPWTVILEIDGTRRVKNTSCDCPAGAGGKCKHICALIYYINNEQLISKTDLPQQWGKPSKAGELKYKKGRTIQDLFPCKRQKHFIDYVTHKDLISMHNILSIPCSLSTLLKEESLTETERQCKQILNSIIDQVELDFTYSLNKNHFSLILLNQKILFINNTPSSKFPLNFHENSFYFTNIALLADNLLSIYNLTMSQSSSEIWKTSRHFRISASMRAHKIKTCRNWTDIGLNKLANSFLKRTDLGMKGNINVKYGNLNEPLAFEKYQELYDDIIVLKAGLIIHHGCVPAQTVLLSKMEILKEFLK